MTIKSHKSYLGVVPNYGNQLKYRKNGARNWKYGQQRVYGDDAKAHWKTNRHILIEDAVFPVCHVIDPTFYEIIDIPFAWQNKDEYNTFIDKAFKKAQKKSDEADGLVNKMFSVGVADGLAWYVVVKENKKTLRVELRNFCPDGYMDQYMGMGGTFEKSRLLPMIEWQGKMTDLFESKSGINS